MFVLSWVFTYSCHTLIRPSLLQWKSDFKRGVVSREGDNLVVFIYLSASEIWPDKRCGLSWRGQFSSIYLSQRIWNLTWQDVWPLLGVVLYELYLAKNHPYNSKNSLNSSVTNLCQLPHITKRSFYSRKQFLQ